jgi:hypothetical protein
VLLPNKYIPANESLLGAALLLRAALPSAIPLGEAWFLFKESVDKHATFLRFTLVLDVLFALSMIDSNDNIILKPGPNAN